MKIIAQQLLFVSKSFLAAPLIVCAIEKNYDISAVYGFSEEEKTQKDIKATISFEVADTAADLSELNSISILFESPYKDDKISSKIFVSPPKHVSCNVDFSFL